MWFERNVMYSVCIRLECPGRVTDGFQKKKKLDRGVGGWVELYPIFFLIFGIFLTLQSPLALPIGNLWQVLRRTRHLNSKAYNTETSGG